MKLILILAFFGFCHAISGEKIINCFYKTNAYFRPGDGQFLPSNINPHLCTHISYSFFGINRLGDIITLNDFVDYDSGLGLINKTIALKRVNPKLKVLAVAGGWGDDSLKYSSMAADPESRARFISSTLSFIRLHGFDGLTLDWEYPAQRGGRYEDRENFVILLTELRRAFPRSMPLVINIGAGANLAVSSYDIPAISRKVDFINVMTYDFHNAYDGHGLGFNAPLTEVADTINFLLSQRAPARKLVLGVASYGQSYQMANSSLNKPGAKCIRYGKAGKYTRQNGFLGYNEICLNNWKTVFDNVSGAPYAFNGNQWVSYDNKRSVQLKMNMIISKKLGGAMVWSIDTDDYRGKCGESWPLLKTISRALAP